MAQKIIAVITGSTRAVRIGPQVAKFVTSILEANLSSEKGTKFTLSQVDIATFKLPVFDEAVVPATVPMMAQFEFEHSRVWSEEMTRYDGYVLITPEYNAGPPGSIKNALDYLFNEIKGKPFLLISYGIRGGVSANDSLAKTLSQGVYAHVVETRPLLFFAKNEPFEYGMPLDMRLASTGKLGEQSVEEWGEKTEDIVKGFEELKEFLVKKPEPAAAV